MNYLELGGKKHPVYWVGSAVRKFWEEVDPDFLTSVIVKIQKAQNQKQLSSGVTDSELFSLIIPAVKWGVWGGYRYEGNQQPPMNDDDIADLIWPEKIDEGLLALSYFFESIPNRQNGQEEVAEPEKKR